MHLHYNHSVVERKRGVIASSAIAGIATVIGAGALIGGGMALAGAGKKAPSPTPAPKPVIPPIPPAPTPEKAEDKAREEAARQKRMRALSGGKTLLTSEAPVLSSGAGKTLLGE